MSYKYFLIPIVIGGLVPNSFASDSGRASTVGGVKDLKVTSVKVALSGVVSGESKKQVKSANSSGASQVSQKKPLKLTNVKLVVEDDLDYGQEKLTPVDPVALRQKPSNVGVAEVKRKIVSLGKSQEKGNDGNEAGKGGDKASEAQQETKPMLVVSALRSEELEKPEGSLPFSRGVDLISYSPFNPPPPGAFPSTLVERQPITSGSQVGGPSDLTPIVDGSTNPVSLESPPVSRVERAVAVDPAVNAKYSKPSSSASLGQGNQSYYTESEATALLHMAADDARAGREAGASSAIYGKMW